MWRALSFGGGLAAAIALSQYPAFSEAYLQRLAGQVDALTEVVQDFDASALAAGLGREEALQQMSGTDFLAARQRDMRATFARHARLSDNLTTLRASTPMERVAMPHRIADPETLRATLADFQPSVPLTSASVVTASVGFLFGWAGAAGALAMLSAPFRRRRAPARRVEPPVARPQPRLVSDNTQPKLGGVRR